MKGTFRFYFKVLQLSPFNHFFWADHNSFVTGLPQGYSSRQLEPKDNLYLKTNKNQKKNNLI